MKLLGHPLHPALAHFPMALLAVVPLWDVAALITDRPALWTGGFYCLVGGLVTGLAATVPGFADYISLPRRRPVERTALWHLALVLTAMGMAAVGTLLRGGPAPLEGARAGLIVGLSVATLLPLLAGGYFGGSLVFHHGIGVREPSGEGPDP